MAPLYQFRRLLRSPVVWTFVVKGANAIGAFAITVLLARMAGAETVGQYALAFSTATLLGLLPLAGMDMTALRVLSGDIREGKTGNARGAWRWFVGRTLVQAVPVMLIFLGVVAFGPLAPWLQADRAALFAAGLGVLTVPLFRLALNGVRALGLPVHGQVVEALPSIALALILLGLAGAGQVPDLWLVILLIFVGQFAATALALLLVRWRAQGWGAPVPLDPAQQRAIRLAGLPLMGVAMLHYFSDWFLLAAITGYAGAAETGAFRGALQIMTLVVVVFTTAETYTAPKLGGDLRTGATAMAWRRHHRATMLMVALASPVLLAAALAPEWVLFTLFGTEFTTAANALRIMAIGQLLNVLTGPVGSMMIMAGRERIQFLLSVASAIVLTLFGVLLIPRFGLEGAAIAYASALAIRNIGSYVMARHFIRQPVTTSGPVAP